MEQCGGKVKVEQCSATVEQSWWNKATVMVEQWDSHGGTVWWNRGTVEQ